MSPYEKLKNGEWNLGFLCANIELLNAIKNNNFDSNKEFRVRLVDNRLVNSKIVYFNINDGIFCVENKKL